MPKIKRAKNQANHVSFVLDASMSMEHLRQKTIEVVDRQVAALAANSRQYNQETRISIWVFSDSYNIECVVWDMDVLRLPSIAEFYEPGGNTALIDATLKSIDDLGTVSQIYGDHSFLMFVWTDGEENKSVVKDPRVLSDRIKNLPDNWTVAALVPDIQGVAMAKRFGFPAGNIQVWDASTEKGMEEAHETILRAHTSYMRDRATGMRSTSSLFDMSADAVNPATIAAAGLTPLDLKEYILIPVIFRQPFREGDDWISAFTESQGHQYVAGRGFYQLTLKPVLVQVQKDIAVVEKKSGRVFVGPNARALLGLPNMAVTLKAEQNPDYDIFIQSTSPNRKLLLGSRYLYLTPVITYARGQAQSAQPVKPVPAPHVAKMPLAPATVARRAAVATGAKKVQLDLTAPVYPKAGKALWAGISCPVCSSKINKRCQNSDGSPMEKPHAQRKV